MLIINHAVVTWRWTYHITLGLFPSANPILFPHTEALSGYLRANYCPLSCQLPHSCIQAESSLCVQLSCSCLEQAPCAAWTSCCSIFKPPHLGPRTPHTVLCWTRESRKCECLGIISCIPVYDASVVALLLFAGYYKCKVDGSNWFENGCNQGVVTLKLMPNSVFLQNQTRGRRCDVCRWAYIKASYVTDHCTLCSCFARHCSGLTHSVAGFEKHWPFYGNVCVVIYTKNQQQLHRWAATDVAYITTVLRWFPVILNHGLCFA